MRSALVLGAGGFIGAHLVKRLRKEGMWVRGVDLQHPPFAASAANEFVIADLSDRQQADGVIDRPFDEAYQLAAEMGGAGFIFVGENDADILHNSAAVNLNVLDVCRRKGVKRLFFASSACVYPLYNQDSPHRLRTDEASAYPAEPDSDYGWEKLFSERLYLAYHRNHGMEVRIGRYHNVFGPEGTWTGGREKAPAALCRKVAEAQSGDRIDIWGDGEQTRSFLYIDECIDGTLRLMRSNWIGPCNIGSDEMVSINRLATMIMGIVGKELRLNHIPGPQGVRGRSSDNRLIQRRLEWRPTMKLADGLKLTYPWVAAQVEAAHRGYPGDDRATLGGCRHTVEDERSPSTER